MALKVASEGSSTLSRQLKVASSRLNINLEMITHIYELATNQYKAKVADNKQFIPFTSIFPSEKTCFRPDRVLTRNKCITNKSGFSFSYLGKSAKLLTITVYEMIEFNFQSHGFSKHISSVTHLKT